MIKGAAVVKDQASGIAPEFSGIVPLFSEIIPTTFGCMGVQIKHLRELLDQLSARTGQSLDTKGFREMEELTGVKQKYLYESIYLKVRDSSKKKITEVTLHESRLDMLAVFLGFRNFHAFVQSIDSPLDPQLLALEGTYWSYVRRNDDKNIIIRSPVTIGIEQNKCWYMLKGPTWKYKGVLQVRNGVLFVLMEAAGVEKGKMIHHVYKIGSRLKPEVLQGIFSGVSTTFDPIGGRTVLVRSDENFREIKPQELTLSQLLKSQIQTEKKIARYLAEYQKNNLRINRVVTFDGDDLTE